MAVVRRRFADWECCDASDAQVQVQSQSRQWETVSDPAAWTLENQLESPSFSHVKERWDSSFIGAILDGSGRRSFFSDESPFSLRTIDGHIRVWRRRLGKTPGAECSSLDSIQRLQCNGLGWHQRQRQDLPRHRSWYSQQPSIHVRNPTTPCHTVSSADWSKFGIRTPQPHYHLVP